MSASTTTDDSMPPRTEIDDESATEIDDVTPNATATPLARNGKRDGETRRERDATPATFWPRTRVAPHATG